MMAYMSKCDRRNHQQRLANVGACVMWLDEFRGHLMMADWSDEHRAIVRHAIVDTEERVLRFARRYGFALGPVRPGTEVDRS